MKKSFTFKQLSESVSMSEVYLRNLSKKPVAGKVYNESDINYDEIKKAMMKKYNNHLDLIANYLGCSIDDFEIVTNTRSNTNYEKIEIDDLVEGEKYLLFSYVNKFEVVFTKMIELDNDTLYVFEIVKEDNKKNTDQYRVLSFDELSNEKRFSIKRTLQ